MERVVGERSADQPLASKARRCFSHSAGNGSIIAASVIADGCRPSRIASTLSGREQREAQDAAQVRRVDLLGSGQFVERSVSAQPIPAN